MRAENLMLLATAHGVNLSEAVKMSSHQKPRRDTVTKKGNRQLITPPENRVTGTETRTFKRPTWTMQELALAAAEVPEVPFMAACYAFAGDRSKFWRLQKNLMGHARMFTYTMCWPREVRDFHGIKRPYLEHLCKLVLDEDANPALFRAAPQLHQIYIGVTGPIWEKQIQERYGHLQRVWNEWLGQAARMIQAKLAND